MNKILTAFIILTMGVMACKKDRLITSPDAIVSFSTDTLFFDTVFTGSGSITQSFKIFNQNDQKILLTSVKLAGGADSPFKINIDGAASTEVNDVEMNANDSLYVFVQVNATTNQQQLPFILEDSISVSYNGKTAWMQLRAYGQNAVFLNNKTITTNTEWKDSLPYVINGFLKVDSGVTLKMSEGVRVFLHADAPVLVNGTLQAQGSVAKPVMFSGDRLDQDYRNLPASWPGIYLNSPSINNILKHVVIQNAYQGIIVQSESNNSQPKLILSQSILQNIYDAGILSLNSSIAADNCLIANCGGNLELMMGGKYSFTNCTIVTYGSMNITHKNPVLQVADFFEQNGTTFTSDLQATFTNCIVWGDNGSVDDEILTAKKGSGVFNLQFLNSIYKAKNQISNATFTDCKLNTPPLFDSVNTSRNFYDFHFNNHPESPAIKAGIPTSYPFDLDGKPRINPPDIGCYER